MDEERTKILPLNKYLNSFVNTRETGIKGNTGRYDKINILVGSSDWRGNEMAFDVGPLQQNRVIIGDRCYIKFRCRAEDSTGAAITDGTIEMRDGVGDLLIQNVELTISEKRVHSDTTARRTSHMYNHINHPNSARLGKQFVTNYVHDEEEAFPLTPATKQIGGYANTSIKNKKIFTIARSLNEVAFMGPRDTVIPGMLPITLKIALTSNPGSCFNCATSVTTSPKLYIYDATFYVYSIEITDTMTAEIKSALASEELIGTYDSWNTAASGTIQDGESIFYSINVGIETTPDFFAIVFEPRTSETNSFKNRHVLTTTWNNISRILIKQGGNQIREYKIDEMVNILNELEQITGGNEQAGYGGISPINGEVFNAGHLSFFPIVNRGISSPTVLKPEINLLSFEAEMNTSNSVAGLTYIVYKVRHQLKFSLVPGQTEIVK